MNKNGEMNGSLTVTPDCDIDESSKMSALNLYEDLFVADSLDGECYTMQEVGI